MAIALGLFFSVMLGLQIGVNGYLNDTFDPFTLLSYDLYNERPVNFSFCSKNWDLYVNKTFQNNWSQQVLRLSGERMPSTNFLINKQSVPFDELFDPRANWTLKTLIYMGRNTTLYNPELLSDNYSSEFSFMFISNETKFDGRRGKKDLSNLNGLGVYARKAMTPDNRTLIAFFIQNTVTPYLVPADVGLTCSMHMSAEFSTDIDLPIIIAKCGNLLVLKVIQQDQACSLDMHLPLLSNYDKNTTFPSGFRVALGARYNRDELFDVIRVTFASSKNLTIDGVLKDTVSTPIQFIDALTEDEIDDYDTEEALEEVSEGADPIEDKQDPNNSTYIDTVYSVMEGNPHPVRDPQVEHFEIRGPELQQEQWKFSGNASVTADGKDVYLCQGKTHGTIISSQPLPSEFFNTDSTGWQILLAHKVDSQFDDSSDLITVSLATLRSISNFPKNSLLETPGNVIGVIVEVHTTSYEVIGDRHGEEVRVFYGKKISVIRCHELTTTGFHERIVSVTFQLRDDYLLVQFNTVWYRDEERVECVKRLYIPQFDSIIAGYEDQLYVGTSGEILQSPAINGTIELTLVTMARLIRAPVESSPGFSDDLIANDNGDIETPWCTETTCHLDCSIRWTVPSPMTRWYHIKNDDSTNESRHQLDFANGLSRLPIGRLINASLGEEDYAIIQPIDIDSIEVGDKFYCLVSNDLGSIQRYFILTSPSLPSSHYLKLSPSSSTLWWTDRFNIFAIDLLIIAGISGVGFGVVRLLQYLYNKYRHYRFIWNHHNHQPDDNLNEAILALDREELL